MIPRTILDKLLRDLNKHYISVLIGRRQVGKTVLMRMLEAQAGLKTTYLDLENPLDAFVR